MGGAVQPVLQAVGLDKKPSAPAPTPAAEEPKVSRASAADEMMGARMRGARRRGRQLLSDARLNPESGIETLGGGNNLG
jgi:hypothetical protein